MVVAVRDLLLDAKCLFVAARVAGCGMTWLNEGGAWRDSTIRSALRNASLRPIVQSLAFVLHYSYQLLRLCP